MDSQSVPEAGCSKSDCPSHVLPLELYVTSNGKQEARPYWWQGWKTKPWTTRLYGTTLLPSTASLGMELWISYLRESLANQSQQPESVWEIAMRDGYGIRSDALLEKLNQQASLLKMSPISSMSVIDKSDATWKVWASSLRKRSSQRRKLARVTFGSDSLSSPSALTAFQRFQQSQTESWPTPRSHEAGEYTQDQGDPDRKRPSLTGAASNFSEHSQLSFLPPVQPTQDGQNLQSSTQSSCQPSAPTTISTSSKPSKNERRRLNPLFVEWLMGWFPGWTSFVPLETGWSHYKQHMRSLLYAQICYPITKEKELDR